MKFYDGLNEDDDNSESEDTETESSDGESKEFTPDHNDYGHSLPEVVGYICELTGASREQKFRIEHELEDLVNRTEKNTFADGFYIAMAVATGKIF